MPDQAEGPALQHLSLLGDLDDVELVEDVERIFAVRFSNDDVASCETVGDLYDLLRAHFPADTAAPNRCLSASAYYKIKAALLEFRLAPLSSLRPELQLKDVLPRKRRRHVWHEFERRSGLELPGLSVKTREAMAVLMVTLLVLVVGAILAAIFHIWSVLLAGLALSLWAVPYLKFRAVQLPADCATLADLSREAARLNYGKLVEETGSVRSVDIWHYLTRTIEAMEPAGARVDRATRFFPPARTK